MSTLGPRARAFGAAFLFGAGGTLVLLTLLLPHGAHTNELGVAVPPLLAYGVVVALLRFGERLPLIAFEVILAFGAVLVTMCVWYGGESGGAYALMYVWVALYSYAFFPPWHATAITAWTAACYGAALLVRDPITSPGVQWVMTAGTIFVAGLLIARLALEVRDQAADLERVLGLANRVGTAEDFGPVRAELCRAARSACGADAAVLLEEGGTSCSDGDPEIAEQLASGNGGRFAGLGQSVLCDGRRAGVLAVGWTQPGRRRSSERSRRALALLAAEAGVLLERARRLSGEGERRALELNDNVVQGLAVARYALDAGRTEEAEEAVVATLARARWLMSEQLDTLGSDVTPGDLRRVTPG